MPLYQYGCRCGSVFRAWRPIEEYREPYKCAECGEMAPRRIGCQLAPPSTRSITSESMGVWPGQQAEATEYARAKGCTGFRYDETGKLHFSDKPARKHFAEAHGYSDRDAGYGDPTPQSTSQLEERVHEDIEQGFVAEGSTAPSQSGNDSD